ncbi:MAG: WD40/YVTN/BNR-like repeat-containing protein [Mycobacteriales bacterium]
MRRQVLASALLVLAAAGCARTAGATATPQDDPPPLDAALVDGDFGWVLTPDALRISTDGGRTFHDSRPGIAAGQARAAYFLDARHGWAASAADGTLTVARTDDGGAHWTAARTPTAAETGTLRLAFGDDRRGTVLGRTTTSAAFSEATAYSTADGGATWTSTPAPVAGELSYGPDGRLWIAGGVTGDELYASDGHGGWARSAVTFTGPVDDAEVSPPRSGVVTARLERGGRTTTATLTSRDGGLSWTETATAAAPAPAHRWELVGVGKCAQGKRDCVLTTTLRSTADAGTHWATLRIWRERLG